MVTLHFPAAIDGMSRIAVTIQQHNISQGAVFFDKSAEAGVYEVSAPEQLEVHPDDFRGVGIVWQYVPQLIIGSGHVAEHNDGRLLVTAQPPEREVVYNCQARRTLHEEFLRGLQENSGLSREPGEIGLPWR